ncbi:MAG: septum site-determining protein MinD [Deltaproteobacteria bacterium]|nr:septum site-determining protein MinD [Deltaproteobacteria bacterium]
MKGTVITITSGKGGVGKTTIAANLSLGLALKGKKTVVIDMDIGLRNLDMILGLENRIVYDIINVMENKVKLSQALIRDKRTNNLHFLPASQTKDKTSIKIDRFLEIMEDLKQKFEYIIIDSPAGIESGFKTSMLPADKIIVVATPEVSSIRDADRIIGILEANEKKDISLIINRISYQLTKKGDMLSKDDVVQVLSVPLLGIVPENKDVLTHANKGEPSILHQNSTTGRAFNNITRRILGEDVELMEIKEEKGFLKLLNIFKGS